MYTVIEGQGARDFMAPIFLAAMRYEFNGKQPFWVLDGQSLHVTVFDRSYRVRGFFYFGFLPFFSLFFIFLIY